MEKENIFGYLFGTVSRLFKKAVNQKLVKYDLTVVQCGVIRTLWHGGELTQAEIADIYSSDRATIGSVIQKLQDKNYLEKKICSTDRRAYVVTLTAKAKEIARDIERESQEIEKRALDGLSPGEIEQLYKTLDKVIHNLERK